MESVWFLIPIIIGAILAFLKVAHDSKKREDFFKSSARRWAEGSDD